jgi:hypothetical protein
MRVLGALVFLLAGGGAAYLTWATFASRRPRDVVFALLAPLALLIAILGLVLVFAPSFLSKGA